MYTNNKVYKSLSQMIEEAVHANHPELDKRNPNNTKNRKELAQAIKEERNYRDTTRPYTNDPHTDIEGRKSAERIANSSDNIARAISRYGNPRGLKNENPFNQQSNNRSDAIHHMIKKNPRLISSAHQ